MRNYRNILIAGTVVAVATISICRGWPASAESELETDEMFVPNAQPAMTFTVTNTAVSGIGSLRQAILDANGNAGADTINFTILASDPNCNPTTHVCTITPTEASPLPFITDRVTIDGYSQPGASVNTLANGDDARLLIELDGSSTNFGPGLVLQGAASGSVISGLVIDNGWGRGVVVQTDTVAVEGCFIGIDPSGTLARPNDFGVFVQFVGTPTSGMRIGGTTPDLRNVISGNTTGIFFQSGANHVVQGNFFGTNRNGTAAVPNGTGIAIQHSNDVLIGGTTVQARGINIPGANGISVLGNSIHSNGSLGIDLVGDGVTQNDHCDGDGGANNSQNFPVITSAIFGGGMVTISGTLDSEASTTFRLEFFSSATGDPSGNGEGQTFIGSTNVTTGVCPADPNQPNGSFPPIAFPLPPGQNFVTATATRLDGTLNPVETSEFSAFIPVAGAPTPTPSTSPTCVPPPPNMVAWYPGDGNANDIIGGNNGTVSGGATFAAGEVDQAFSFNGVDGFVSVAGTPLTAIDNWTLDAWINPGNLSQGGMAVSNGFDDGFFGDGYAFGINGDRLQGLLGGVSFIDGGFTFPAANQWYHVAMVRASGTVKFFVNGVQTPNTFTMQPNTPTQFRIGSQNGVRFFNGLVDEVEVFSRALSEAEIQSIVNAGSAGKCKPTPTPTRADFDGDGRTDLSVFRPSEGNWYLNRSTSGFAVIKWGISTDTLVPGDYDGDGKADEAIFRPDANPANADYYILNSSGFTFSGVSWGVPGDIPVIGDYDGDRRTDLAVFRPSESKWYILNSSNGSNTIELFGLTSDVPLAFDLENDGRTNLAVYRPSNNTWYIARSTGIPAQNFEAMPFGLAGDKLVPADYDGDNKDDVAVYRPSNGTWYIRRSSNGAFDFIPFGISTDVPVPGDYDGDGKDDVAVYRNGTWYVNRSTSGLLIQSFGLSTDTAIPTRYIP